MHVLTEVTYDDGEYVIKQGETSDTFYIIVEEGGVHEAQRPGQHVEKPQHLGGARRGRTLRARAPRSPLSPPTPPPPPRRSPLTLSPSHPPLGRARALEQCARGERGGADAKGRRRTEGARHQAQVPVHLEDAFEEVLGPLQAIIDEDRKWREKVAEARRNREDKEKLSNCKLGDAVQGGVLVSAVTSSSTSSERVDGAEYTLKSLSKQVVDKKQTQRVAAEGALASFDEGRPTRRSPSRRSTRARLPSSRRARRASSRADGGRQDRRGRRQVLRRVRRVGLAELTRRTRRTATLLDALTVDERGCRADGLLLAENMNTVARLTDYCGLPYYLSPEQVRRQGHDKSCDWWQLGICRWR